MRRSGCNAEACNPRAYFVPPGDPVRFSDEAAGEGESPATGSAPWVVLVADDDRDVHDATTLALAGEKILGRELELLHAYGSADTLRILQERADVSVVLLDVVMETPDAGLRLIDAIRQAPGRSSPKIVVRTGQPGRAPEAEIRSSLAIDGYLTKARLTRALLVETLGRVLGAGEDPSATAFQ